ncbi:MAG: carbon-nitrogen hydrolase [Alphaproteobacteria bacterium]|nr:carbon-nitrogen hydrolase [Alphaproteobacteria bacterium]
MSGKPYKIALIQMRCDATPSANLKKAITLLKKAAAKGAKVVCLPELFMGPYFCQKQDASIFDLAEPIPGPTTQALAKIAKETKMTILASLFEKRMPGMYHNTLAVLLPDEKLGGIYRKMHIPDDPLFFEKYYFTPGDLGFKNFDVPQGRIGTLVCWDQWFPEAARATAMQGAEVLFYPTAIGWHPAEKKQYGESQASAWETIQRSHAIANGVYVASVNRIGHEKIVGDGIEFWGNSFIADPFGRVLAKASSNKEEILIAEVSPALQEETRRNWPFFRDRRIEHYGALLAHPETKNA